MTDFRNVLRVSEVEKGFSLSYVNNDDQRSVVSLGKFSSKDISTEIGLYVSPEYFLL